MFISTLDGTQNDARSGDDHFPSLSLPASPAHVQPLNLQRQQPSAASKLKRKSSGYDLHEEEVSEARIYTHMSKRAKTAVIKR